MDKSLTFHCNFRLQKPKYLLSILIPVYNFDVRQLVIDLHAQCLTLSKFEILCLDDASSLVFHELNQSLNSITNVTYTQLSQNIGRSAIRNKMMEMAQYPNLLFMDCDSAVPTSDYISKYIPYFGTHQVVYGGRKYAPELTDTTFALRWKYGTARECLPAEERNTMPYTAFMTNNFLISKSGFDQIRFDETLKGYGYEDSKFALDLKKIAYPIVHIDNPLVHIGLETAQEFLAKTKQGLDNLSRLIIMDILPPEMRIYTTYLKLKKFGMKTLFKFGLIPFEKIIVQQLKSTNPSLFLFDLYRLHQLSKLA